MRQLCRSERILLWGAINVSKKKKRKSYFDLIYAVFHKVLVLYGIGLNYLHIVLKLFYVLHPLVWCASVDLNCYYHPFFSLFYMFRFCVL